MRRRPESASTADARTDSSGVGDRIVDGQRHDLGAGPHDLAHLPVAQREHVVEHAPLVVGQALVAGHDLAQLLVGELVARLVRVAAEQAHDSVRRHRQEPDHRPHERGEAAEHRRDGVREPGVVLDGEPLGRELAEHQRQVGDEQGRGRSSAVVEAAAAESPRPSSSGVTDGAIDDAPYAADAKPATVTPICTAERKVFGLRASPATVWPRSAPLRRSR